MYFPVGLKGIELPDDEDEDEDEELLDEELLLDDELLLEELELLEEELLLDDELLLEELELLDEGSESEIDCPPQPAMMAAIADSKSFLFILFPSTVVEMCLLPKARPNRLEGHFTVKKTLRMR